MKLVMNLVINVTYEQSIHAQLRTWYKEPTFKHRI